MSGLILDSLEVRNFRGFRHLQIERLGRVNLIVGKNNVGKTSLLEALQLYAQRTYPTLVEEIWEQLRVRDESIDIDTSLRLARERDVDVEKFLLSLRYLFYGRDDVRNVPDPITIGPIRSLDNVLSISIDWYTTQSDSSEGPKTRLLKPDEYDKVSNSAPRFTIKVGKQLETVYPLWRDPLTTSRLRRSNTADISCIFIPVDGLRQTQMGEFWNQILLRETKENDVYAALRVLAPGVERLAFTVDPRRDSIPIVKISSMDEPVPIRSLGNGMMRVLNMALALVNLQDGMLLIDEFENGLHYSIQPDIWRLIFQVARRLNVQVFATTHSQDCIRAFTDVSQEGQEGGLFMRLQEKKGEISAVLYDMDELRFAVDKEIEVR
jgi:hypothetical protein